MKITGIILCVLFLMGIFETAWCNPVEHLLERIMPGSAQKFELELVEGDDFFELSQKGDKILIRGNNYISLAVGVNWYLKYYAGIHLSWNQMQVKLLEKLPRVERPERHTTRFPYRYDFNYCTHSYSMAFWDWERWEKEIDWMVLHGINMPLMLTGIDVVWYRVLEKMGYRPSEINQFIAGPAFQAWWYMNNLEGWGGPNPENWYKQQEKLAQQILKRMREFGIEPVFPGYAGMIPSSAKERGGVTCVDPGLWCGFRRPCFLLPTDPSFERLADLYYTEMRQLYGESRFFSVDPFHEGGNTKGMDLALMGRQILQSMKKNHPEAVWVIQAWQANPRPEMIDGLEAGDLLVLDLSSENRPMWGDSDSPWCRKEGYKQHHWLYCMLLNYGGNVGMYGRMERIMEGFNLARNHPNGTTLRGVGLTMEGIENNPVMYELMLELPWREKKICKEEWLEDYVFARYGVRDSLLFKAWRILGNTVYHCPRIQEGTTESLFCARPAEGLNRVSSWGSAVLYYKPEELRKAAAYFLQVAHRYRGNNNFEYDLIDVVRQVAADYGNELYQEIMDAYQHKEKETFSTLSRQFLDMILWQDRLLSCRPEFMLGRWLQQARKRGMTREEKQLYEWNARTQITVWGPRQAANQGGLRDYAHREWAGLLKDYYYPRWEMWFEELQNRLDGHEPKEIDWYALEEPWTRLQNEYLTTPQGNPIQTAQELFQWILHKKR